MLNFLLFLLSPLMALAGATNLMSPVFRAPAPQTPNYAYSGRCFIPEINVTLEVTAPMLDAVHNGNPDHAAQPPCHGPEATYNPPAGLTGKYILVRRNQKITDFKIDQEGAPFNGGCGLTGSALRWVGNYTDGRRIYWEDQNYKGGKMFDFIYLQIVRDDPDAYYFDVYATERVANDPEGTGYHHVSDCTTSGGIVPVLASEANLPPPQTVTFKEITQTPEEITNYNKFAIPINVPTQVPGTIGPTVPATYRLFPPPDKYLIKIAEDAVPAAAIPAGQIGKVTKTYTGTTHTYDIFFHLGSFYLRDEGDGITYRYESSDTPPPSSVGIRNPSLQLGVLQFRVSEEWNPYIPVCKPAIYLYPEKTIDLNVKLDLDGRLTDSIPIYNKEGWNVRAYPDGKIQALGTRQQEKIYPYLYYEADVNNITVPKEGWVVERSNIKGQMSELLSKLGLNQKESDDFLAYWVPKLVDKPYYFVTLLPQDVVDSKEKLTFSESPDTLIRVRFIFEGLDNPVSVAPLDLPPMPKRSGFVAVDWGGGVVGGSCEAGVVKSQVIR